MAEKVKFYLDINKWVFPLSFCYDAVGNRHRPWTFRVGFLCFELIFWLDEDSL